MSLDFDNIHVGDFVEVTKGVIGCKGMEGRVGEVMWKRGESDGDPQWNSGLAKADIDIVVLDLTYYHYWGLSIDCKFESHGGFGVRTVKSYFERPERRW